MSGDRKSAGVLGVFSGECLMGVCGEPAGFTDMRGELLFVGDIVLTFTVTEQRLDGCEWMDYSPDGLTVVVSDEWRTYSDGTHLRKDGSPEFFVMGIKSVPMDNPGEWRVRKLKSYSDVVNGERWPAYGFNYRSAPDAVLTASGAE